MTPPSVLAAFSPFLVGTVIAVSGMTGGGLLLHQGTGILRGAVSILALQCGALAAGIWAAEGGDRDVRLDALRGWWVAAVAALTVAAALSAFWQFQGLPQLPLVRGALLGVLVGLPQVAMGGTAALLVQYRSDGALVLAGASLGFLAAGLLLLPYLAPTTVYVGCVAALGAAAALHSTSSGVSVREGQPAASPGVRP